MAPPSKEKVGCWKIAGIGCLSLLGLIIFVGVLGNLVHTPKREESSPSVKGGKAEKADAATGKAESQENVSVENIKGLGKREVGTVDDVDYAVVRHEFKKSIGNDFSRTRSDGIFCVVQVGAWNNSKETHNLTTSMIELIDSEGRKFQASSEGTTAMAMSGVKGADLIGTQVHPGVSKSFILVYDVPETDKSFRIHIPAGTFSGGKDATIKVY